MADRHTRDQLRPAIEPTAYLGRLRELVRDRAASYLGIVSELGEELHWKATGPTVRMASLRRRASAVHASSARGWPATSIPRD